MKSIEVKNLEFFAGRYLFSKTEVRTVRKIWLFAILLSSILMVRCTYTSNIRLNCDFESSNQKNLNIHQPKFGTKLSVSVTDKRRFDSFNSFVTAHVGQKIIDIADKPIADTVYEAMHFGLQQMGFAIVNESEAKYIFNCVINSIEGDINKFGWKAIAMIKISVHCYLVEKKNKKVIWQDRVIATGSKSYFVLTANDRRDAFCHALTDLMQKIQNSKPFHMAFNMEKY